MTPDALLSLAESPLFIQGIYNYCDRWCERCPMTAHCLLYAATTSPDKAEETTDSDAPFNMLRQAEESIQLAVDLLNQMAIDEGMDATLITEKDPDFEIRRAKRNGLKATPLSRLSKGYLDKSNHWMRHCDALAAAKDAELFQAASLQLPDRNPEQELNELKDALDVINWYQFQIHVKLVRAQSSLFDEVLIADVDEDEDVEDSGDSEMDTQYADEVDIEQDVHACKDSDGSAKVALIGIDRSIGAWQTLLQHFPDQETPVLEILSLLQQLLRETELTFPDARNVKRVGLD